MKNLIAAVLVIMAAVMIFLYVKIDSLEKELRMLHSRLEVPKDNEEYVSVEEQEKTDENVSSPVPTEGVEQVVSSAIVTDRPAEITGAEPEAKHKVYLTFDDGPSKHTETILDILDEYGVKATFFVVGKEGEENAERLRMIYERGHTIGMHSYSHDYSEIYESEEAFRADFLKSKQYIFDATGVETIHYRFPGGSSNALSDLSMQVFIDFLDEQGMEYYDWNISSGDGASILIPVETILENCTKKVSRYDTSIILMHDSAAKTTTVEALPRILETILAMEDTVILPITENTQPVHHAIKKKAVVKEKDVEPTPEPIVKEKTTDGIFEIEIEETKVSEDIQKEQQGE
ncbi:MAG: polysaccharide deacetylase [Lachnospiraceae bacterium]|nr:polysaccharide deacetylase [Lachnospiraceae bacterium]